MCLCSFTGVCVRFLTICVCVNASVCLCLFQCILFSMYISYRMRVFVTQCVIWPGPAGVQVLLQSVPSLFACVCFSWCVSVCV